MFRKILSWALIVLGSILLGLSVIGIGAIWIYRVPLTNQSVAKLNEVDQQLTAAQTALDSGKDELQRTLRIVESAEKSLAEIKDQLKQAKILTDEVNGTLDSQLMPGLQSTRDKIAQLRGTIQQLRDSLKTLNAVPFLNLNIPGDEYLGEIMSGVDTLDKQIATAQDLTKKAATFVGDASYLMGGDLGDTKERIRKLLDTVTEYDQKVGGWHAQVRDLIASVPRWINEAAVVLTLFLIWFAISQFGLILHGLALQAGKRSAGGAEADQGRQRL